MSIYLCGTFFANIVQVCEKKRQIKATHIFKVETPQTTEGKSESERNFNGRNTNKLEYRHYLYTVVKKGYLHFLLRNHAHFPTLFRDKLN